MKIKLVSSLILALALLVLASSPVYAIPALPHAFYGDVEINGASAPNGSVISATVDSGTIIAVQNPVTTDGGGYGISSLKLLVQGDNLSGAITFYVNGHIATPSQAVTFEAGGGPTRVDLSVTITEPSAPPPPTIETNLFGIEGSFRISSTGEILETIEATSEDGMLTMTIEKGTIALLDSEPLETLTTAIDPSPPCPLGEDAHIIGLTYAFEPDGATFAPPITFTWSYDPDALPEGVAEKDLIVAYCDAEAGEWVELDCVVDTENNTITASVAHFTTFAIIGSVTPPPEEEEVLPVGEEEEEEEEEEEVITVTPAAFSVSSLSIQPAGVKPGEAVTVSIVVANTGGESGSYTVVLKVNGVKEVEKSVTVAAGESLDVSFSVTREDPGNYTVDVDGLSGSFTVVLPIKPPGINWAMIGGIIGGVIVVGLGVFFWMRRRRAA